MPEQADASVILAQAAKKVASFELRILADDEDFVKTVWTVLRSLIDPKHDLHDMAQYLRTADNRLGNFAAQRPDRLLRIERPEA